MSNEDRDKDLTEEENEAYGITPHNHYNELTPKQREKYDKIEAAAQETRGKWTWTEEDEENHRYWTERPFEHRPPPKRNNDKHKREEVLNHFFEELMKRFTFKTLADSQEIYFFDIDGVFRFNGEVKIRQELEKIFNQELESKDITIANLIKEQDRKEIISRIKANTFIEREEFDNNGTIINVDNGLLDTRTKKIKPHDPEFLSTKQFL